ncbi:hypothetical protein ACFPIJ_61360 [Dactylosporangium cerinum]|uniref:Uncharacterized protein n=1 Tax=Dactylosporangium cerinum TaxID=1434730 RepID=A0ABV9WKS2_9ACTN
MGNRLRARDRHHRRVGPRDGDDSWRCRARAQEILPLPPTFRLAWGDDCASGGTSGNCTAEFVVTATDGAAPAVMIERLADHLSTLGWHMETDSGAHGRFRRRRHPALAGAQALVLRRGRAVAAPGAGRVGRRLHRQRLRQE